MDAARTHKREQGQTIVMVAVSLFALLAMAALAIDVTTMYVASTEAQQAADAAALAGAKAFVTSGYTTYPSGYASTSTICNGSTGLADYEAQSALSSNAVAGISPTITTSCSFAHSKNPTITVRVQRSALPVFFARIWGASGPTVSATATAEAYNPSGGSVPLQVRGVKPWLFANCYPGATTPPLNPNCGFSEFVDPATGNLLNPSTFMGQGITLTLRSHTGPLAPGEFYALDIPTTAGPSGCPFGGSSPSYCSGPPGPYYDNIACFNTYPFSCGEQIGPSNNVTLDTRNNGTLPPNLKPRTDEGTQCLIHQSSVGTGQDVFIAQGIGLPILIQPGTNNPDSALSSATYISRSDSVITIPLYDGSDMCAGGNCTANTTVLGFLQVAIQQEINGAAQINALILNAAGCSPSTTGLGVTGGGLGPIPVRLIQ